jgi:hypothetical protein
MSEMILEKSKPTFLKIKDYKRRIISTIKMAADQPPYAICPRCPVSHLIDSEIGEEEDQPPYYNHQLKN